MQFLIDKTEYLRSLEKFLHDNPVFEQVVYEQLLDGALWIVSVSTSPDDAVDDMLSHLDALIEIEEPPNRDTEGILFCEVAAATYELWETVHELGILRPYSRMDLADGEYLLQCRRHHLNSLCLEIVQE